MGFTLRRSGEIGRRAGFKIRGAAGGEDRGTPAKDRISGDSGDLDADALAPRLRREPDLAELVTVWPLLPEHSRRAIMTLARAEPEGGS